MIARFIVNVEAAVVRGDHYLMIVRSKHEKQDPGALSFPGGKVEAEGNLQDVLEETLRREVLEESGLGIDGEIIYIESKAFTGVDGGVVDVVFLCFSSEGDPIIQDSHEVGSIYWMTAAEIINDSRCPQWTQQAVQKAEAARLKYFQQR
jgi:8-oxo-dGTP diphosphatase